MRMIKYPHNYESGPVIGDYSATLHYLFIVHVATPPSCTLLITSQIQQYVLFAACQRMVRLYPRHHVELFRRKSLTIQRRSFRLQN